MPRAHGVFIPVSGLILIGIDVSACADEAIDIVQLRVVDRRLPVLKPGEPEDPAKGIHFIQQAE